MLVNDRNQHILAKEIPHNAFAFDFDYSNAIKIFVPKKTCELGMNYNVYSDLVSGSFDHLFVF